MINSLKPPTDNLYKFITIIGILIIIVSSSLWWKTYEERDSIFLSLDITSTTFDLGETYSEHSDKTSEAISISQSVKGDVSLLTDVQQRYLLNLLDKAQALEELSNELVKKTRLSTLKINTIKTKYENVKIISIVFIIIGFSLMLSGFYLWNTKLQKYIDKEIKNKINSH